jgi:histone acetyltransferase (RNA polymerase elongator complex component)
MKSHAIIPIFIPHKGCPNSCVFCNQNKITLNEKPISETDVSETIEKYLDTLKGRKLKSVEVAFYGGSFTGIPIDEQSKYLDIATFYKRQGLIDKVHLSTRPDYISDEILENLKGYDVDTIELGVQSFDDDVLAASNRGHDSSIVHESSAMIKALEFELGLQLMIGLPGDTPEKSIYSAHELVKIKPAIARLYPTIIIENTVLHDMFVAGEYYTPALHEYVSTTKSMYKIIYSAGINIIRVGLRSADLVKKAGENFHPAFRQLVESEIARDIIVSQLEESANLSDLTAQANHEAKGFNDGAKDFTAYANVKIKIFSNEKSFSNMIGHKKSNKLFFAEKYPVATFSYEIENSLADNQYVVKYEKLRNKIK